MTWEKGVPFVSLSGNAFIGVYAKGMVAYRRNRVQGACYFFTVNVKNRRLNLLTDHIDELRLAFKETQEKYPFNIIAIVILPDHIHAIWRLPAGDDDYSGRWKSLKANFTHKLQYKLTLRKNARGEYGIWQSRFWEHTIRDEQDMQRHIDYIHYNPVKHGYCQQVNEWQYSSFHHYVQCKKLAINWGGNDPMLNIKFGE